MTRIFVWVIMIFGGTVAGLYFDNMLFAGIRRNLPFHIVSFALGISLLFAVMRVSRNTGRTLAKYGRVGELKRMETNVLVTQGPYKYMRHPMHLGLLFFPVSIAFLVGSPSFIVLIAPVEMILILLMIKFIEEPGTIRKFGAQYIEYKEHIPWFCLRPRCLRELLKDPFKS
jgi:protein-S-isoprenylcysteine O-methyltransferase Ste14